MHVLAATGDTWGISEPEFLRRYAALAVITVIATVLVRRWIAHSSAPGRRLVNPDDVSYLHGGPELTVLTTLSALYVAGRISSPERRCVKAVGAVCPDAGELERAIHLSAHTPCRGVSFQAHHRWRRRWAASSAGWLTRVCC